MRPSAKMVERSRKMRRGERRVMDVYKEVIGASAGDVRIDLRGEDFKVVREW